MGEAPNPEQVDHIALEVGLRDHTAYDDEAHDDTPPGKPIPGELTVPGSERRYAAFDVEPLNSNYYDGATISNRGTITFDVQQCKAEFAVDGFVSTGEFVMNCENAGTILAVDNLHAIKIIEGEIELSMGPEIWENVADQADVHLLDRTGVEFECRNCGHSMWIQTPYSHLDQWCEGECDGFQTFDRVEEPYA